MKENGPLYHSNLSLNHDNGPKNTFSKLQEEAQLTYNSLAAFPNKLMRNSLGFQYDDGLELVMAVLKLTNSIQTLDVRNNCITTKALGLIKDLIVSTTSVRDLYLGIDAKNYLTQHWGIGDEGALGMAVILLNNHSLQNLDLEDNNISERGARAIAESLCANDCLARLSMKNNKIGPDGVKYLINSLAFNNSLVSLDLSFTGHGDKALEYLSQVLTTNKTLKSINLSGNAATEKGAKFLSVVLSQNNTLKNLVLDSNELGYEGCSELIKARKGKTSTMNISLNYNHLFLSDMKKIGILYLEEPFNLTNINFLISQSSEDCKEEVANYFLNPRNFVTIKEYNKYAWETSVVNFLPAGVEDYAYEWDWN